MDTIESQDEHKSSTTIVTYGSVSVKTKKLSGKKGGRTTYITIKPEKNPFDWGDGEPPTPEIRIN